MAGRKVWVDGDRLYADDLNGYLMNQAVVRFADATQRDADWAAPGEGAVCYVVDPGELMVYDNAAWRVIAIGATLDSLTDVDAAAPDDGDHLAWDDGTNTWVPVAPSTGGLADQGSFTYLDATEAAAPGTPASGKVRLYAKSDGRIYSKDDAGVEYGPFDEAGGGSGLVIPAAGVDWMRWPSRRGMVGTVVADHTGADPLLVSDGSLSTFVNSASVTVPQAHHVDLGAARPVTSCRVVYYAAANRSDDGELQYSNDGSSWTAAATWTDDTSLSRLHTFSEITARYWRVYTSQTGSPGTAGVTISDFRLYNAGTDYAAGVTPTFSQTTTNAANATDGNDATTATASNGTMPQRCTLDLTTARTVHSVRVVFSALANQPAACKVQWSSDNSTWNDIGTATVQQSQPEHRFDFTSGQSARYWRVEVGSAYDVGNGVNWSTVEVWGE